MVDVAEAEITIRVSYHEARALRSAADREKTRTANYAAKRPFTPEPGRVNLSESKVATLTAAIAKVDTALTAGIEAHKEAANGQG